MPQETKTAPAPAETPSLQGLAADRDDRDALLDALEKAFDYRGDVTVTTTDGRQITGYIFDRRRGADLERSLVRLMTPGAADPVTVRFAEIDRLVFTGKDAAHGRSFETWIKKYLAKKAAGEEASIHAEPLDESPAG
ncbi:MAG: hypothetical protein D6693_03290 [Planctomycetota bacterium]|nr:MAG: hypothetical protein D6693_03290 [Planctomycetota bacterium]